MDVTKIPTGSYDLGFDIYWMDSSYTTKHYNVMIWIYGNYGSPDKIVSDGINDFYYYHRPVGYGWPWDAFVLKNQSTLLNTISNSEWDVSSRNNWMIPDIQLGNEVPLNSLSSTTGKMEINKYNINLNGNLIQLNQ